MEEQLAKRMGRETDADVAARAAEEERKRRQADPFLAALPEGLQKRQQVRVVDEGLRERGCLDAQLL